MWFCKIIAAFTVAKYTATNIFRIHVISYVNTYIC